MRASLSSRLPAAFVFVKVRVNVFVFVNNLWNLWNLCDVFVRVKVIVIVNNLWNLWDPCDVLVFRVVFLREAGLVKKIPASSKKSRSIQSEKNSYITSPFDNVPNQRSTAWRAISSQPRTSFPATNDCYHQSIVNGLKGHKLPDQGIVSGPEHLLSPEHRRRPEGP